MRRTASALSRPCRRRRIAVGAATASVALLTLLPLAAPARAAFPGRNGNLAVEPARGGGIVLVAADGGGEHKICREPRCTLTGPPAWSPDGRTIAFPLMPRYPGASPDIVAIYADGTCVICNDDASYDYSFGAAPVRPSFRPDGWMVTHASREPYAAREGHRVLADIGVDGFGRHRLHLSQVSAPTDPAWSAGGRLAYAARPRGDARRQIFVSRHGTRGVRQRTGRGGRQPSWSPDGRRLAFVRYGRIYAMPAGGGRPRRVTRRRAHSPAFSPDGRRIAFVRGRRGAGAVMTIGPRGRHPRRVGDVRGRSVAWQPIPTRRPRCRRPPHSRAVPANGAGLVVTRGSLRTPSNHPIETFMGYLACSFADGRWRQVVLAANMYDPGLVETASSFTFGGRFVAFASLFQARQAKQPGTTVSVFDMRDGSNTAEVGVGSPFSPPVALRQLLVSAHGAAVWRAIVGARSGVEPRAEIRASGPSGSRLLDSGPPRSLSNFTLNGDTASWLHDGVRRSAALG